jgi:hypothetical protein
MIYLWNFPPILVPDGMLTLAGSLLWLQLKPLPTVVGDPSSEVS